MDPHGMEQAIRQAMQSGDWAEAARLHAAAGQFKEAARLHERLLDLAAAADAYLQAGDGLAAMDCARRSGQRALETRILQEVLRTTGQDVLQAAARVMLEAHRPDLAAPLFDGGGDVEGAAQAYEQAGMLSLAARRQLALGNHRQAGQLLEQHLATAPGDAQAMLELGAVLARFGRHDVATPLFRKAARHRELAEGALRRLALSFFAQGHPHAAHRAIEELRALNPSAPEDMAGLAALENAAGERREKPGTRVQSRYLLLAPRSASSLGDAYLAYDEFEDRRVILTLFRPEVAQSQAIRRFAASARAAAALDHPQLLALVEFNLGMGFMVTAVPHGAALEHWLRRPSMPSRDGLIRAVGAALCALHRRGITHGALNVANVHLSEGGEVQVSEAGAGVLLSLRETESQGLQTSLSTLAPEVIAGGEPDLWSDQYALAAMTYHLVTGHWPQPAGTPRWQPPSTFSPDLTPFDDVLARALAPRADGRFPTLPHFLDALPSLPDAAAAVPELHQSVPPPRQRYVQGALLAQHDGVRWHAARDVILDEEVALGEGPAGSFAWLDSIAGQLWGTERVRSVSQDASRCVVAPAVALPEARALFHLAQVVAALHRSGLSLAPAREARVISRPPHLRISALPACAPATDGDQAEDLAHLWRTAEAVLGPLPGPPADLDALQRVLADAAAQAEDQARAARVRRLLVEMEGNAQGEAARVLADAALERP